MTPDHLLVVLDRWFPRQDILVTRAGTGGSTPVFQLRVADDVFWVRPGEDAGERRDGEVAAHRLLLAQGVPVPDVVRYEAVPPDLDRSLALTSHISGVPLATMQPGPWFQSLVREVGRVLAQINRTPVRGFGWAFESATDGVPVGQHSSRAAWAEEYRVACESVCASGLLPTSTRQKLQAATGHWLTMPDLSSGWLAHGDFDATHIYLNPASGQLTGIIDFGELRCADPLYDLGHLLLHDGESGRPTLFPDILKGYQDIVPLPADVLDAIRNQALVIGTRALAIQLQRAQSSYRDWLTGRLVSLTVTEEDQGGTYA